jgi:hypothetical protein
LLGLFQAVAFLLPQAFIDVNEDVLCCVTSQNGQQSLNDVLIWSKMTLYTNVFNHFHCFS